MSYASDGLDVYFGTGAHSQKAQNLARDPRASAAVTLPYKDWSGIEGVSFAALAHRVTDADETAKVARLMLAKFPQVANAVAPDSEMAIFRLAPVVFSLLDYRKGFGHTELATV